MQQNNKRSLAIPLFAAALLAGVGTGAVAVFAQSAAAADATTTTTQDAGMVRVRPAAVGKVTAISGSTITLTDEHSSTTYTIDASGAKVVKHTPPTTTGEKPTETEIAVSDIKVDDFLMIEGTVNGTSITATTIHDGQGGMHFHGRGPGVHGTVSSVSGSTVTITGDNGTTYTVNADGATVSKMVTIPVSDLVVGDQIGVDGTVNGTTVTAEHIMTGMQKPPAQ